MKTIKDWLKEGLSKKQYKKAKKYKDESWEYEQINFEEALNDAFLWANTEEGWNYWNEIHTNGGSIQPKSVWDIVERFYPHYTRDYEITYNNDLQKIVDDEINGGAEELYKDLAQALKTSYKPTIVNYAAALLVESDRDIFEKTLIAIFKNPYRTYD